MYDVEKRRGAHVFGRPHTRYQICVQCVMDTSDPEITFDENGVCHHCHDFDHRVATEVFPPPKGHQELARFVTQIKREGRGKKYDCILGLSGGVDSTYVAYLTKKLGLRPLAVHLDNGWNSEIAVRNIENIVQILDIDLYTRVLDWEEFRALQVAFLRASTPDSEIPTDHAIVSTLYEMCVKHKVRWIMDGSNIVTEIMSPATWSHGHGDWKYISHLNEKFGGTPLKSYPHYTYYDLTFKYRMWKKIERFPILNYIEFDKLAAMKTLERELGWQPYGGKHYESIYTRFYQGHILPTKFGFDKRRCHLSCLVRDNRITRDKALAELQQPAIDEDQEREDREFVRKKLGLSEGEFEEIMLAERKTFWDFPSDELEIGHTPGYARFWKYAVRYESLQARWEPVRLQLAEQPLEGLRRVATYPFRTWFGWVPNWKESIRAAPCSAAEIVVSPLGLRSLAVSLLRLPARLVKWLGSFAWRWFSRLIHRLVVLAVPVMKAVLPAATYERLRDVGRRVLAGEWGALRQWVRELSASLLRLPWRLANRLGAFAARLFSRMLHRVLSLAVPILKAVLPAVAYERLRDTGRRVLRLGKSTH